MFRSAGRLPTRQNSSLRSSDKPLGAAVFRLNGTLRNITIFSDVSANTYTAVRRGGKKAGQPGPCGGCVYPEGQVYDGEKGGEGV